MQYLKIYNDRTFPKLEKKIMAQTKEAAYKPIRIIHREVYPGTIQ